jgi:hypothetical protein
MEPAPSKPSPPALLTADANRQPLHQIMPAWMMGKSMPKREVILLFKGLAMKSKCKVQNANVKM